MEAIAARRLLIGFVAASLTGCAAFPSSPSKVQVDVQSPIGPRPVVERGYGTIFAVTPSGKETVLHSFGGGSSDGANPHAGLLNVNGTLYGTTRSGGAYNGGTLFAVTPSGPETIVHSFGGSGDGADPMAALINVGGVLYGTTRNGGNASSACADGCGVVFSITASGTETVLHSFGGYPTDGAYPEGDLLNVGGTFYGTTRGGGSVSCKDSTGCGTVFTVAASGAEDVLFSFGAKDDDCCPSAGLINVNGTLYGTSLFHFGKVFKIGTSGGESSVHKFKGYPRDGAKPYGGLVNVAGTLYGTTVRGGAHRRGAVFAVPASGGESQLYSFTGGAQGEYPYTSLLDLDGALYGTSSSGGADGRGAVFAITTAGAESVIYSFKGYPYDGASPYAGFINVKGTLYGTTEYGGANVAVSRR
jgi:uncharacterized repeat protein (TIGR03803 family)